MTETIPTNTHAESPGTPRRDLFQRIVAALKLESSLYEEVEHDPSALGQAAILVAAAALAGGIGAMGSLGTAGFLSGLVQAFVSWVVWTTVVWLVGVKVLNHTSDFEELLRTLGFVAAPQLLLVLAILPVPLLTPLLGIVVLAMTLVAFTRALRQALDVDTGRAVMVGIVAVLAQMLIVAALSGFAALL